MAYDPEAREKGNSALVIGIVALVLIIGGALAYFATRPNEPTVVATPPTTIERNTTVVNPTPASPVVVAPAPSPNTVVVERAVPVPGNTTRIERNTTTNTTRVVPSGGTSGGTTRPDNNVNVTVNTPPASSTTTETTTNSASNTASDSGTSATPKGY